MDTVLSASFIDHTYEMRVSFTARNADDDNITTRFHKPSPLALNALRAGRICRFLLSRMEESAERRSAAVVTRVVVYRDYGGSIMDKSKRHLAWWLSGYWRWLPSWRGGCCARQGAGRLCRQ